MQNRLAESYTIMSDFVKKLDKSMTVLKIVKMGDPVLSVKSVPVTVFNDEKLHQHIADMVDTMRHYQGVGLAAPQTGLSQQIVVLEVARNTRYPEAEAIALDILINPQITAYSEQTEAAWEGCLSLPGLRGRITRSTGISYQAFNAAGEPVTETVYGFHARIIQHEIDHLNGILYPQRLDNLLEFGFEDSLPAFQNLDKDSNI